jgi:hypothetical protein
MMATFKGKHLTFTCADCGRIFSRYRNTCECGCGDIVSSIAGLNFLLERAGAKSDAPDRENALRGVLTHRNLPLSDKRTASRILKRDFPERRQ